MKNSESSNLEQFITSLPGDFLMRSDAWLAEEMAQSEPPLVVDVRDAESYRKGHIAGSINIPVRQLPERYKELSSADGGKIICYCNGSVVSAYAIAWLAAQGIQQVYNLSGGFSRWQKEGRPVAP